MPNIRSKSQYEPSAMVMKSPQLTISLKTISEKFEYSLYSADLDRPKKANHMNSIS